MRSPTRKTALPDDRIIGHYRILAEIGRGGMGIVYRARDLDLDREVALKRPLAEHVAHPRARTRFLREARLMARLSHPNIVPIFEVLEHEGVPWIAMQLIEGCSLGQKMGAGKLLPVDEILRHGEALADALAAAHARKVLHRDLKPNNVILDRDGRVLLTDFGLAGFFLPAEEVSEASTRSAQLTEPGGVVGTPGYMPPEQILGRPVDGRSDIFSLGAVLYEMCTGRPAFRREAPADSLDAVLHQSPPAIARFNYDVPEELEHIIRKAIAKSPDERYQSAIELHADLSTLRRQSLSGSVALSRQWGSVRRTRRATTRWALSLAVVSAIITALIFWRSSGPNLSGPAMADATIRPGVAVVPVQDGIGEARSALEVRMLADLIRADLSELRDLHAISTDRIDEITRVMAAGVDLSVLRQRVAALGSAAWVASGVLYREKDHYVLKMDLFRSGQNSPQATFRVDADRVTAVAAMATRQIRDVVAPDAGGGRPEGMTGVTATSEEAASQAFQARQALRDKRYLEAVHGFERAVSIDPRFLAARVRLATALYRAGFSARALSTSDSALRLVDTHQVAATPRQELLARAVYAQVREDFPREAEARRVLASRYPGEPEILLELARALNNATRRDESLAMIRQARAIDPRDPRGPLRLGTVLVRLERFDEASAAFDEADRLFARIPSPAGRAEVAMARGFLAFRHRDFDSAAGFYRTAADIFGRSHLEARMADAWKSEAEMETKLGHLDVAGRLYRQAIPRARESGNLRLVALALSSFGGQLYVAGDYGDAEQKLREAVEVARRLKNPAVILSPLLNLAGLLNYLGRVGEGRALAEEAAEAARQRNDRHREGFARTLIADAEFHVGQLDAAIQTCRDLVAFESAPGGSSENLARAQSTAASVFDARGSIRDGLAAAGQALTIQHRLGKQIQEAYTLFVRADLLAQGANWDAASADLDAAESVARRENGLDDLVARVRLVRGHVAIMRGDAAAASGPIEEARRAGEQSQAVSLEVPALTLASRLAVDAGHGADAAELARRAVEHPRARAHERVEGRVALARALAAGGDWDAAEQVARRALDEAESMGLSLAASRAADVLCESPRRHRAADLADVERRGREAFQSYLTLAPDDRLVAMRERSDLRRLFERFDGRSTALAERVATP
ncbi:MAG: protein kinase [Acidobacteriota bacterium]